MSGLDMSVPTLDLSGSGMVKEMLAVLAMRGGALSLLVQSGPSTKVVSVRRGCGV